MTQPQDPTDARLLSQWEAVRAAAAEEDVQLEQRVVDDDGSPYPIAYEQNRLLISDSDRDSVEPERRGWVRDDERSRRGVGIYRIEEDVVTAVRALNAEIPRAVPIATPVHVVSICPVQMCPSDEPVPLPPGSHEPHPPRRPGVGGQDVVVDVLDTGLEPDFASPHEWLADIPNFRPDKSFNANGQIKEYGGHGTFVTGVLRCAAPATPVKPGNIFRYAGATTEDRLANALETILEGKPQIISLSAGVRTLGGQPLAALEPFFADLSANDCTTLLVAAAGNNGETDRFYPAAYAAELPDAVVAVGALRHDGRGRACFSNYGDWVSVFAPGERHVNAYLSGSYTYHYAPQADSSCRFYQDERLYENCTCVSMPQKGSSVTFHGMARWSGTSFSTPLVAGAIATHMSTQMAATGEMNARESAAHVLAGANALVDEADGQKLKVLQ